MKLIIYLVGIVIMLAGIISLGGSYLNWEFYAIIIGSGMVYGSLN